MSYVRWSSDSDLYIYDDIDGGTTCCCCILDEWDEDKTGFNCATHDEMIAHVERHIAAEHAVPDFVIPRLRIR